jgi:hypothetical protein
VRDVPPEQRQPQAPPAGVYDPDVEQVLARTNQIL